jgi:hypothetical protein
MVSNVTIDGQNGSNWQVTLPDGVTLSQAGVTTGPYFLDNAHPALDINYKYDLAVVFDPQLEHGITSISFADLDGGGQSDDVGNGLRGLINLNITNDLGVPLGTTTGTPFFIYLADGQSDSEVNPPIPSMRTFMGSEPATAAYRLRPVHSRARVHPERRTRST